MLSLINNQTKLKVTNKKNLILYLFTVIYLIFFVFSKSAFAFSPNWNPNNLIDNGTLTNSSTMSAHDIQAFLQNIGSGLANYSDIEACDSTIAAYYHNCGSTISAAQIIYDSAQAYNINPRVILATLEKEQSLVTDPAPSASQINCAMGYNSCGTYVGFFTQVDNGTWALGYNFYGAARQLNWLAWHPSSNYPCSNAKPGFYSNGLYPGNTVTFINSGGTPETINIINASTASLYCYTPYVGPYNITGYSGSYNFVYYYQLWFGSTQASSPYAWQYQGQTAYSDSSYSQLLTGTPTVAPGGNVYAQVSARNVGYNNWSQSETHIGTDNPRDRLSSFFDSSWLSTSRPGQLAQVSVSPGNVGTFNFILHAPQQTGTYYEYFNLVDDGVTWMNDPLQYFTINVVSPTTPSHSGTSTLSNGQKISIGQYLISDDSHSTLMLQSDGNLVENTDFSPVWASYKFASNPANVVMQSDGNLVEYSSSGNAIWNSGTSGNPGAFLSLQTDGNLVIYSSLNKVLWSSGVTGNPGYLNRVTTSLPNGSTMYPGQSLETANRKYKLTEQSDGNLVLYYNGNVLWATQTNSGSSSTLSLQTDGNLVEYGPGGNPLWASYTAGNKGDWLALQTDGNVVLYSVSNKPLWQSGTSNVANYLSSASNFLLPGNILGPNQSLTSDDGKKVLVLQADGNLVAYNEGIPVWSSGTVGQHAVSLSMQNDGNLVLYNSNQKPIWCTGTNGRGPSLLDMQNDGNLVLYSYGGNPTWQTGLAKNY